MFCDGALNCENFQDLNMWCSALLYADPFITEKSKTTEDVTTLIRSPAGDSSPSGQSSFPTTPRDLLSPVSVDVFNAGEMVSHYSLNNDTPLETEPLDIANMPIVFEEEICVKTDFNIYNPMDTYEQILSKDQEILPSMELTQTPSIHPVPIGSYIPIDHSETAISEYILNEADKRVKIESDLLLPYNTNSIMKKHERKQLRLNFKNNSWESNSLLPSIATPDVVNVVDEMEAEKFGLSTLPSVYEMTSSSPQSIYVESPIQRDLISDTPEVIKKPKAGHIELDEDHYEYKPAAKRRRRTSEDSDESYTPYAELSPPRRKRKTTVTPAVTEDHTPVRRGRPPKRRESIASVSTIDDASSSVSTEEMRYRELRDKNNVASKRSRMNRKQKERQMEELGDQLEERNKKLRVKAKILEDLTIKLKEALMSAILGK